MEHGPALGAAGSGDAAVDLRPYAPRGCLQWLNDEPGVRYRAVDGSLVFVDISGFTAMSERLARAGPVGAEEVTDLLNHTFSRLLAVAYEDDGSLLKFGGDALLLLFEGSHHTERAVHAAVGMRRKLRSLQPLRSSVGQVRLRMSVGVHTGVVEQFLVGSRHRELVVVGPTATHAVRMENEANAGEIVVSDDVAAVIGSSLVAPLRTGHLLRRELAPPVVPRHGGDTGTADLARHLLSPAVVRRLESSAAAAEHHPSAVAFVKVLGTDALLRGAGPDRTADALEAVVDAIDEAVAPDDVCLLSSDVDADGAKFILTAGVPTSHEFDGERLLRAARRLVDADLPLRVKVGMHHGAVFAGVIGPPFRLTYTIIGDAVNLAARVMGRAEPGEILATPEVLNRSQSLFDVTALEPFAVKGKKRPVTAYRVGELTASRSRHVGARFPLAGRRSELAAILDEVDVAVASGGRIVQLTGDAGIGKSRLVDELQERRSDVPFVVAACNRYESTTPYFVVGQLVATVLGLERPVTPASLRRAVRRRAPHLDQVLPLLGDVVGVAIADNDVTRDLTPGFRAARAADAVAEVLGASVPEPAVLVVEDLHWADPESWSILRALVTDALPGRRWAFVSTSRTETLLDRSDAVAGRTVHLEPLGPSEARELVFSAIEDGLVSLDRGRALLERAGGNPFFLEELLRFGGDDGAIPSSVDALVQTQLDELPAPARALLGRAAVLGADFEVVLLAAVTGADADVLDRRLGELGAFVVPDGDGRYRFRHALLHDAAYGRLPFRDRRDLHLAAASVLEERIDGERRPDLLAIHTFRARDWERARRYAVEAAELASARFANLTAAAQYRHAIESGRHVRDLDSSEVARTWERLADALMLASAYDEAVRAYQQARRVAPDDRQAHLCGQIGQLRERQGRYADALRWLNRGITLGGAETARLLVEAAVVRARQGNADAARALADRAEALRPDVSTAAKASYVRAWCAMLQGVDGADDRQRALELFEQADDLIGQGLAFNIISMSAYYRGDWDEAADAYERAGLLRRRVGDEVAAAAAAGNLGELLADQGHFDRARGLLEECRNVCGAAGFQSSRWFATMTLGRLDARVGRFDAAAQQLADAREALEAINMQWLVFDARRYQAELAVFRGDLERAVDEAAAVDVLATLGSAGFRSVGQRLRTCVHVVRGDRDGSRTAAKALLDVLDEEARDYDTALGLVAAAVALEQAGDDEAADVRARARRSLGRLGVVVPGELLLFGPSSPLVTAASVPGRVAVRVLTGAEAEPTPTM